MKKSILSLFRRAIDFLHHCPCPPARNWGSRVSGLVYTRKYLLRLFIVSPLLINQWLNLNVTSNTCVHVFVLFHGCQGDVTDADGQQSRWKKTISHFVPRKFSPKHRTVFVCGRYTHFQGWLKETRETSHSVITHVVNGIRAPPKSSVNLSM